MTQTRAVLRMVQPSQSGAEGTCAACHQRIVWKAKQPTQTQVICNVYLGGAWSHVETMCGLTNP